jgi:hypothetical protein
VDPPRGAVSFFVEVGRPTITFSSLFYAEIAKSLGIQDYFSRTFRIRENPAAIPKYRQLHKLEFQIT